MNRPNLKALISLLDDPDEIIFDQIRGQLISYGEEIIPELELAWEENSFGILFQERIENIVHTIQYDLIFGSLSNWASLGGNDLLRGALLVAKYQYPDLDEETVLRQIEAIRKDVWIELNDNLTALEKIKIMNHIMFDVHGFSGNTKNYHAPHSSFINNVVETRKGNPISLSIIYMIIAQQLDLPVFGVNLPKHFVLAYQDRYEQDLNGDQQVLFYVNPFSKGVVFSRREITDFLKQLEIEPKIEHFQPCTNIDIIHRVLNNLIYSYQKLGYQHKIDELTNLKNALQIKKLS